TFIPKEQSSANISNTANASRRTNSDDTPKQIEINSDNISDNTSNPDICHESSSQYPVSSIRKESKSLEDKVIDEFLDLIYKEKVSKEIIQKIREKKLQKQEFSSILVEELYSKKIQKFIQELYLEPISEESIKVIKNKEPNISDHNENNKHIVIELAHLYQKARKAKKNTIYVKQEKILSWYYYAEDDLAESEVSASPIFPSNPTRDYVYFHNKILKQYPNLCQEEGRYKIGSYNLKYE
ncbi:9575_t:CDS:2, partial [Racocetra fulgida]